MIGLGLGIGIGRSWRPRFDADASAWIDATEAADGGPLEPAIRWARNAYVLGLKADGLWPAIAASCPMAGAQTLAGALVPMRGPAPTNHNFIGGEGGDFDRVTGLKGDGATKYLDSNRNNNADGQDDNHNAVWVTDVGLGVSLTLMGAGGGTSSGTNIVSRTATGGDKVFSRNRSGTGNATGLDFSTGLIGAARAGSAGYTVRGSGENEYVSRSSQTPLNGNVLIYTRLGVSANFADARIAIYSIGAHLDLAIYEARMAAYMAAVAEALT